MRDLFKRCIHRPQPVQPFLVVLKAGFGGLLAIGTLAILTGSTSSLWLMAPFGASCVLLFGLPQSPLSQPINVVGGHIVSTAIGLGIAELFRVSWRSLALAVGLAIFAMSLFRITHPPAGADPLVVMAESVSAQYLLFPVASGSIALVIIAWIVHRVPPSTRYSADIPG